ncbi:unnamed protein product [Lepeophtheirus salmonis]|uniref:(salmon louse) hypothetical protein n=1 Tax=Lepeophtheirus salmonis TaxID=72036 RepID=A0A7R8CU05_LEPSM|nr:unnamed protein product [Lepeophtheirus salmonis]CAF2894108.1 unnamed protein product [Lepeophtheirus salmonis]
MKETSEVTIQLDLSFSSSSLVPKISTYTADGVLDVSNHTIHVSFNLRASIEDISLKIEREVSASVSSGSPIVRKFVTPPKWKGEDRHVTVVVRSNVSDCGLLGIQPFSCPFHDVESSMVFRAKWQAFLGLAAIDIRTSDEKYQDGFYIILITKRSPEICISGASSNFEELPTEGTLKHVTLTIYEEDYYPLAQCRWRVKLQLKFDPKKQGHKKITVEDGEMEEKRSFDFVDSIPSPDSSNLNKVNRSTSTADLHPMKFMEIVIIDKEEVQKIRNQKDLTLKDLAITCDYDRFPHTLHMKSSLYVWIIFLMGIFYSLPVFQLVKNYEKLSDKSGDENICYYNYLCKVQWAYLKDYGHVF